MKKASKVTIKVSKMVAKETGVVDDGVIDAVAEAAENQADADPNASITDRVKMAGKPMITHRILLAISFSTTHIRKQ